MTKSPAFFISLALVTPCLNGMQNSPVHVFAGCAASGSTVQHINGMEGQDIGALPRTLYGQQKEADKVINELNMTLTKLVEVSATVPNGAHFDTQIERLEHAYARAEFLAQIPGPAMEDLRNKLKSAKEFEAELMEALREQTQGNKGKREKEQAGIAGPALAQLQEKLKWETAPEDQLLAMVMLKIEEEKLRVLQTTRETLFSVKPD